MNRITELFNKTTDVYDRAALTTELLDWVDKNSIDIIYQTEREVLLRFIRDNYSPQDVFSHSSLSDWAENNGYGEN